ncbi:condensation domain-containing protein [Clostridium butyricum]|nr:hypothetical protein [Clostridium butyricum]
MGNKKNDIKNIYVLSPMQTMMLFNSIKNKDSIEDPYFRQCIIDINGDLKLETLKASFDFIIEKYDILRSNFIYEKLKQPMQVVLRKRNIDILFDDLTTLDNKDKILEIESFRERDKASNFNLSKDLLMRVHVFKVHEEKFIMVLSSHHISMDGWCVGIILKDLLNVYDDLSKGREINIGEVKQYDKYIEWLQKQNKKSAVDYWKEYLKDFNSQSSIPKLKNKEDGYDLKEESYIFDKEIAANLKILANESEVTLSTVINILWGLVVQAYNKSDDALFGMVVSGRGVPIEGIESMIGLFINTVPMRVKCNASIEFKEILKDIQNGIIMSEKYSFLLLTELLSQAKLKNDAINHMAVVENFPVLDNLKNDYFSIENIYSKERTNYDFNLLFYPGDDMKIRFTYNKNVYSEKVIEKIMDHLKEVAINLCKDPNSTIRDTSLKNRLYNEINECIYDVEIFDMIKDKVMISNTMASDDGDFDF